MIFIEYVGKIINIVMEYTPYIYIYLYVEVYIRIAISLVPIVLKLERSEQIGTRKKKKNTANLVPITLEQGWEQT